MDKADMEAAQPNLVMRLDYVELDARDAVLLELEIHQRQRELGAVQGHGYLTQHIWRGADVILMTVREQHAPDALAVFDEVGHIRDDQIHAQHVLFGEDGPAVHHQHVVAVLHNGDVFAKFINAA